MHYINVNGNDFSQPSKSIKGAGPAVRKPSVGSKQLDLGSAVARIAAGVRLPLPEIASPAQQIGSQVAAGRYFMFLPKYE